MHLDLSKYQSGAYVVLNDVPNWSIIKQAYKFMNKDSDERIDMLTGPEGDEFIKAIFSSLIDEWSIRDRRGNLIPFEPGKPFPVDKIGNDIDGRIVSAIFAAAQSIIIGGGDEIPNAPSA